MEKLKEKFNDILNDALVYWEEVKFTQHNNECAEEAKKLAIEFYNWMIVSPDFRYDIEIKGDTNDYFNLFLKEFYK